ncbi:unnamed protein product [Menidia menidia]|uniref:(Atlantic silverside) hypothetical protein n=1 Tax=Menidia menidia TaxID=238744 RepID=A0A8S4ADN8_9TELE|nr:unnamed protein product [Menidia menidia]
MFYFLAFQVELHLKPIQSMLRHQKPLVFVLNSPQSLIWNVKAENLAPYIKHTFHVSLGSEVHFMPGNFSILTQIQREILPHGNEHLLNWAQKKYRAVTSFSELMMTQDIYIKVGEDPVFPDICQIDTKFLSLNYLGSREEPQTSKGCILSNPEKGREVHIIELQAPNPSSAFQVDVIVDIRPLKDDDLVFRDVVLLLKCTKSVNWVVKTHNINGNLDVVASDTVSLSSQMTVSKSPKQHLPSGPQALINWAQERGYSPVTSFTSTLVANHFKIRLREPDIADPLESKLPPELSILHESNPQPEAGRVMRLSNLPFPFPQHLPDMPFLPSPDDDQPWQYGGPEEKKGILSVGLSVQCEDKRMVVSINKESLREKGITHATLTLQDPECKATDNETHYTLESPLTGCQTLIFPIHNSPMALHLNYVRVTLADTKDGTDVLLDYEDQNPEDAQFQSRSVGSERTYPEPYMIEFNCTYRKDQGMPETPVVTPRPARQPVENTTFIIELYDMLPPMDPSRQVFFTVSQNQQVYVEVTSTTTDPDVGFTIISCFISPNSNPKVSSQYILIETVCPMDDSVEYFPVRDYPVATEKMEKKRFSFTFNSKFNIHSLFLHCEMSPCTKKPQKNQELPPCLEPSEPCDSVTATDIMAMIMNAKVSTKPLAVLDTDQPDPPNIDERTSYTLDTQTVVGIALAAFVIGALLTGALWFIYTHTGETAVPQPVQRSQPASENSSTAHSIGSTQSTPCSSSSTA